VLEKLAAANVRLKPSKCAFGLTHVLFLGHEFNAMGYGLSLERKHAVNS
jgi:hypothetical protein